jgi:hypothetical protein
MRNILSAGSGIAVDEFGKKRAYARGLPTRQACSVLCRVDKLPTFTPSFSHVLQVIFHRKNRHTTPVNSSLLPTINTPNKSNNKLNNLYYC